MDFILIRNLVVTARIGVLPHELLAPQEVIMDVEFGLRGRAACISDQLEDTIDYAEVAKDIKELAISRHFGLVEFLAEQVSQLVLNDHKAPWVRVRIEKIGVVPSADGVGVEIQRRASEVKLQPIAAQA